MKSNFNKSPAIKLGKEYSCFRGWTQIAEFIGEELLAREAAKQLLVLECYHGANQDEILQGLRAHLNPELVIQAEDGYYHPDKIAQMVYPDVTDDRIFGRLSKLALAEYLDPSKVADLRARIEDCSSGLILVIGIGATLISPTWDLLLYADMARWEIQMRMRGQDIDNLGVKNREIDWMRLYKPAGRL